MYKHKLKKSTNHDEDPIWSVSADAYPDDSHALDTLGLTGCLRTLLPFMGAFLDSVQAGELTT